MAKALPYLLTARSQMKEGQATAEQHARAAKASYAEGTRSAAETRRGGRVIASDVEAAIAGGGGVTDDPGSIQTLADIEQVTDYNALTALYEGSSRAREHRKQGRTARKLARSRALATAITGASKMFEPT